jgi:hypothetical protein
MRQLAQLDGRPLGLIERLGHEPGSGLALVLQRVEREPHRDDRMDKPLLGSVVQIADHPPALGVGRRHDPRA